MSNKTLKPFILVTGAVLLGGLAVSQSAFAVKQLGNGYQVNAPGDAKATEGKCGEGKCGEGKCGANKSKQAEGTCGMMKADSNNDGVITQAEHRAHADSKFAAMDTNKDGSVSGVEMKAGHEGKCGEGKCGEGKCGADKK